MSDYLIRPDADALRLAADPSCRICNGSGVANRGLNWCPCVEPGAGRAVVLTAPAPEFPYPDAARRFVAAEIARCPRVVPPGDKVASRSTCAGSAPRAVLRSGYRADSAGARRRRIALRRNVYRCRAAGVAVASVGAGAFALDLPVAGVLAAMLVFTLLRCAAEARAEL